MEGERGRKGKCKFETLIWRWENKAMFVLCCDVWCVRSRGILSGQVKYN